MKSRLEYAFLSRLARLAAMETGRPGWLWLGLSAFFYPVYSGNVSISCAFFF
jgi:hypothetical protein